MQKETNNIGFFKFGPASCFGRSTLRNVNESIRRANDVLPDARTDCTIDSGVVYLSFDPGEIATSLWRERYMDSLALGQKKLLDSAWIRQGYYQVRKFLPVRIRKHLQRAHLADWQNIPFPNWPLDCSVDLMFEQVLHLAIQARNGEPVPFVWFWPRGYAGGMIMTHDVEQAAGRDYCSELMDLNERAGLRSSFQVIPEERYEVRPSFLDEIRSRGHEVNVHDLNHDGQLFQERTEFLRRASKINAYARKYNAKGFRSGVLYRNLEWYDAFDFDYDLTVPNVAHLDPQRGGCCTVMPYFINRVLELPLTTTQDYSLFHILNDYSIALWDRQIQLVLEHHGLLSFNIHPDYIQERRAREVYAHLLSKLASVRDQRHVWMALPSEVNRWWRQRSLMELVRSGESWQILGDGSERACVAYASVHDGGLVYSWQ